MAKARMLHKKISTSLQINNLPLPVRLLFTWLIPHADDEGRLKGEPQFIKATVIPMTNWSLKNVRGYLEQMKNSNLIYYWQENNEWFIEFVKWGDYQSIRKDRFEPSKLPSFNKHIDNQTAPNSQPNDNQLSAQANINQSNITKVNKSEYKEEFADKNLDKGNTTLLDPTIIEDPKHYLPKNGAEVAAKIAWEKLEPNNPRAFYTTYLNAAKKGVPASYIFTFTSEIRQDRTVVNPGKVFQKKVQDYLERQHT